MITHELPRRLPAAENHSQYRPIADYGVIGDMHTAILISSEGSIDWGCLPHFDSPAMFLRLLDWRQGGYCAIQPADRIASSRRYVGPTNILETTFTTRTGRMSVTDFMPVRKREGSEPTGRDVTAEHRVIRMIQCTEGTVEFSPEIKPTFSYAAERARTHRDGGSMVLFQGRQAALQVQCPELTIEADGRAFAHIRLAAGERTCIVLTYASAGSGAKPVSLGEALAALERTEQYWTEWSRTFQYNGDYRDEVLRSTLVAKLLTFEPTGAIVASPTTSLPEAIGGQRNWDYRLSWLRDSQFVITALMHRGYFGEAHDFFHFLHEAAKGPADEIQILYGIRGERVQREHYLTYLEGYRESKPVRVGNAAGAQKQMDVYGELLNCMHSYSKMAASAADQKAHAEEVWSMVAPLADLAAQHWREPDNGIWESRGGQRHFVHSKAMCWVALDRAIKLASIAGQAGNITAWQQEQEAILNSILSEGFNAELGAFVQSYGSSVLDASILRLPIHGVIEAADPRMLSTIQQIESQLTKDGLVYRYRSSGDQLEGQEAAFTTCTFWLINNYILLGRRSEAKELFEHVLSFQNDLQLFAEEIDPSTGEQLGNFPQALTHVGLISAAGHLAARDRHGRN